MKNKIKSMMVILVVLAMIISLLPTSVFADQAVHVSDWAGLQNAIIDNANSGKTIVLDADITAADSDSNIEVDGKTVTLDLNGKKLDRHRESYIDRGLVIFVSNGGALTVQDSAGGGVITGGWSRLGGGINVGPGSTCNLISGSITGNRAEEEGGGFCVYGTLNMSGGTVSGNTATDGGGIFIQNKDGRGTVNLSGGSVRENTANRGGGIVVHGVLTMTGGDITGNDTKKREYGGGVYVCNDGEFYLNGGSVSKNTSNLDGGAIYTEGTVSISGGSVTSNTTVNSGGAICIRGGQTAISGGSIRNNTAYQFGGAIYINNASLNLTGGTISSNVAINGGGGVWMDSDTGSVTVSGNPVVQSNKANDIRLSSGKKLVVNGKLDESAKIGVYLVDQAGTFTQGFSENNQDADPSLYFEAEAGYSVTDDGEGEAMVIASDWLQLQRQINNTANDGKLSLSKDWKAAAGDKALEIPEGKTMTLNLNGHTIDRALGEPQQDGEVLIVKGALTIDDDIGVGKITGGNSSGDCGGGIRIENGGTLNLKKGDVTGNKADEGGGILVKAGATLNLSGGLVTGNEAKKGGGISNHGTLEITDGMVSHNQAAGNDNNSSGGGIYNAGSLTMSGGVITMNITEGNGGGLCLAKEGDPSASAAISGGNFTFNSANYNGGAVYLGAGTSLDFSGGHLGNNYAANEGGGISLQGRLNVKGTPSVYGNGAAVGKNIMLGKDTALHITGALSEGAKLDVATAYTDEPLTDGLTEKNAGNISAFSYNEREDLLEVHDDPKELFFKAPDGDIIWVGTWTDLQNAINNDANNGKTLGLSDDLVRGAEEQHLTVSGNRAITLELNGHTLNGNNISVNGGDRVMEVLDSASITIRDSAGTGAITGGNDEDFGGAMVIRDNATCNLEGVCVKENVNSGYSGGAIYVTGNGNLNMTGGRISGNNANYYGGGIYSDSNGTMKLNGVSFSDNKSGKGGPAITFWLSDIDKTDATKKAQVSIENCFFVHNCGTHISGEGYGAIFVNKPIILNINNTLFSANIAGTKDSSPNISYGGALSLTELCEVTIEGGGFINNKAIEGGAIYVYPSAQLTMKDVRIANNQSTQEGGGGIHNEGEYTKMTNCQIVQNSSSSDGGGIYNTGSITLDNCTIDQNSASGTGGGISTKARDMTIQNCTVSNNKSSGEGGGIALAFTSDQGTGSFTNVTATGNQSDTLGGGIFIGEGHASFEGGSVSGNTALENGDGIYVSEDTEECRIKGSLSVKENMGTDFYLDEDVVLKIEGPLSGSQIGIALEEDSGTFTSGYQAQNADHPPAAYFIPAPGYAVVHDSNGEAKLINSDWPNLQTQINEALSDAGSANVNTLVLEKDWTGKSDDSNVSIPAGKALILDLNGYTINRNLSSYTENGEAISIEGVLTIKDSSGGRGTITGGYGGGGGIVVRSGGTLTFEGGTITGNYGNENGGGILNLAGGTLSVTGGEITNNTANKNGGGIYSEGTLTVSGGKITSNNAGINGGGIALGAGGLLLSGGEIKENAARYEGGGIFFEGDNTAVNVQGKPVVTGNHASTGKNILLKPGKLLGVSGSLNQGALMDLTTQNTSDAAKTQLTSGLKNGASKEAADSFFTYNEAGKDRLQVTGEGDTYELTLIGAQADAWAGSWQELANAINDDNNAGKIIGLKNDITATDNDDRLLLDNRNVTVDLNGHRLDRHLDDDDNDGHVFELSYSTLTIRDSAGSGIITGGYAKHGGAINIHEGSVLNFESGTITGNRATESGGGIFVYGTLNMTGGTIVGNSAESGGGIYCHENASTDGRYVSLKNVTISGNSAEDNGAGIDTHAAVTIENCQIIDNRCEDGSGGGLFANPGNGQNVNLLNNTFRNNISDENGGAVFVEDGTTLARGDLITGNRAGEKGGAVYVNESGTFQTDQNDQSVKEEIRGNTAGDCGGIFNCGTVVLNNTLVSGNTATECGGAGLNNRGTAALTGSEFSTNKSKMEGGAIYTNGGNLSLTGCTIHDNESGGDGGAICLYTGADINNCELSGNNTKQSGGALRILGGTVTINGGTLSRNDAEAFGGAIYINNGATLNLKDCAITDNVASEGAGGIFVNGDTAAVNLEGKVIADGNNSGGSDIYLVTGKTLSFSGPLTEGSKIGICLEEYVKPVDGSSPFTAGFREKNPDLDPVTVFVSNDGYEVYLDGNEAALRRIENEEKPFIDKNSQVVKDYTKLSSKNWMAGISGERYLYEINIPGTHDSGTAKIEGNISTGMLSLYSAVATVVLSNVAGVVLSGLSCGTSLIVGNILGWGGSGVAPVLVSEYFKKYAQCQERFIDEQLVDGIRQFDIRLNTYYAENGYPINEHDDGENLYLLHGKDKNAGSYFCKDHDDNFLTFKEVLEWMKDFLDKHPTETVIMSLQIDSVDLDDVYDEGIARIKKHLREFSEMVNPSTGESYLYMDGGVFGKPYSHIPQLKDCRGKIVILAAESEVNTFGGGTSIGQDVSKAYRPEGSYKDNYEPKIKHLKDFYTRYGGRPLATDAGKDSHIDYYFSAGTNGTDTSIPPDETPLEIRDKVFEALFSENGVLMNRKGTYLGLVNMDGVHAKESRIIWETNFFEGLKYCTVTVKSGENDNHPKTYTVLSGTPIIIPGDVYGMASDTSHFYGWNSNVYPEGHGARYFPGEFYTVMQDVTFTENWSDKNTVPIRIEWKDGDDHEKLRPEGKSITLNVTKDGAPASIELKEENNWQTIVEGNVTAVQPVWDKTGSDEAGKYKSEVSGDQGKSYTVTLTHTPDEKISVKGNVSWKDKENTAGKRPESVMIHLLASGRVIDSIGVRKEDDWSFNFGERPKFVDGEEVLYSIEQEEITGYKNLIKGFLAKNFLPRETGKIIHGWVLWGDNGSPYQPKEVKLKLMKGGTQVAEQTVTANKDGEWPFRFVIDQNSKYSDYRIEEEQVNGYASEVVMGNDAGDIAHVLNVPAEHRHTEKEISIPSEPATCTKSGTAQVFTYCSDCGLMLHSEPENVNALGHDWGKWRVTKEATETAEGEKCRTCKRDPEHVQTRTIPKVEPGKEEDPKIYNLIRAEVTVPDYTEDEYKNKSDSDVKVKIGKETIDPAFYTVNWPESVTVPETAAKLTVTATDYEEDGCKAIGTSREVTFAVTENTYTESEVEAALEQAWKDAEAAIRYADEKAKEAEAALEEAKKKQKEAEEAVADAKEKQAEAEAALKIAEEKLAEAEQARIEAEIKRAEAEAIAKAAEEKAKEAASYTAVVIADRKMVYNGKTPKLKSVVMGSTGAVTYLYFSDKACTKQLKKAPTRAGTWYVKAFVEADGQFKAAESSAAKITILKAANKMTVKARSVNAKAEKDTTLKRGQAFIVKKAAGRVSFKKLKGSGKILVTKGGTVKVKKGLEKGKTYSVKVKVTASGSRNYRRKTNTVTLKVKVR